MIGHSLRHVEEWHSFIDESRMEGTRLRGRPRTKYISQIIQNAGVFFFTFHGKLECMTEKNGEVVWREKKIVRQQSTG